MATLTEWALPLNSQSPYPYYLRYLTPEKNGLVYYTKYVVDVVGQLDVTKHQDNVVEWDIPPRLWARTNHGTAAGIRYGPDDKVWFALQAAHQLVEFNPATGLFTGFYGDPGPFPIPFPTQLMFDEKGRLWYTGAGTNGALIGCFDPSRQRCLYWDLPVLFLTPSSLWVEASGDGIWLTIVNSNQNMKGPLLARLDPSTGRVVSWGPPTPVRPVAHGVVGEPVVKPRDVWFTYDARNIDSRVYRLNVPTGRFFEYAPDSAAAPASIALDRVGTAWITDPYDRIRVVERGADCGTVVWESGSTTVEPTEIEVRSHEYLAEPTISTAPPLKKKLTATTDNCYRKFVLPSPHATVAHIAVAASARRPTVYFTENGINTIGRLS